MTEETAMTKEELQAVINEMSSRVVKVAELVDQVFPDQEVGIGIKECADKLCGYVQAVSAAPKEIHDELDMDPLTVVAKPATVEDLKRLALENCVAAFKKLKKFELRDGDLTDNQIGELDVLSTHARELFTTLVEW